MVLTLITLLQYYLPGFTSVVVTFFPISTVFGIKLVSVATFNSLRIKLHLLKRMIIYIRYWNSLRRYFHLPFILLSPIYLYHYEHLFYTVSYNSIPYYLFSCSNCSKFDHGKLFQADSYLTPFVYVWLLPAFRAHTPTSLCVPQLGKLVRRPQCSLLQRWWTIWTSQAPLCTGELSPRPQILTTIKPPSQSPFLGLSAISDLHDRCVLFSPENPNF